MVLDVWKHNHYHQLTVAWLTQSWSQTQVPSYWWKAIPGFIQRSSFDLHDLLDILPRIQPQSAKDTWMIIQLGSWLVAMGRNYHKLPKHFFMAYNHAY